MKKWLSYIIDGVLVVIILLLGYTQVSMMVTRNQNYGVPKAFGLSFLYIATNSMEIEGDENSLGVGTGIIIASTEASTLKRSTPIYEKVKDEEGNDTDKEIYYKVDENGSFLLDSENKRIVSDTTENAKRRIVDYELNGDVVTFYDSAIKAPNTHRVIDWWVDKDTSKIKVKTMGDNPDIHKRFRAYPETENANVVQTWNEEVLIGKVTSYSKALGEFLVISSPAIAATAIDKDGNRRQAWLFPVAVLVPLIGIAVVSMINVFIKLHKEHKEKEQKILDAAKEAGIDPNNEEEFELFRMKEELRLEYRETMEEERAKVKASIAKAEQKALKEARKALKKEGLSK